MSPITALHHVGAIWSTTQSDQRDAARIDRESVSARHGEQMVNSTDELKNWVKSQEHVVVLAGAYLAPIKDYVTRCKSDATWVTNIRGLSDLHALVQKWDGQECRAHVVATMALPAYEREFRVAQAGLVDVVTSQSFPSTQRASEDFIVRLCAAIDRMSEVMVTFAKLPVPAFSVNLAANTPFDAYLLITRLMASATEHVYIVDNYLDVSLFDRYLYRIGGAVRVSLRTNPDKWKKKGWREQFEQAEALFARQRGNYDRADRPDIHARYVLTESAGWRLDGSIKDIAASTACPIHTISPEERQATLTQFFS